MILKSNNMAFKTGIELKNEELLHTINVVFLVFVFYDTLLRKDCLHCTFYGRVYVTRSGLAPLKLFCCDAPSNSQLIYPKTLFGPKFAVKSSNTRRQTPGFRKILQNRSIGHRRLLPIQKCPPKAPHLSLRPLCKALSQSANPPLTISWPPT
jgi:hypothetical protein